MPNRAATLRSAKLLTGIGHELKTNPPKVLAETRKKKGPAQAEKQRVAILLSKARAMGMPV